MTSASREMDSGAALRASVISACRSIRYRSSGAMLGYGVLASCACPWHAAASITTNAKLVSFIDSSGVTAKVVEHCRAQDLVQAPVMPLPLRLEPRQDVGIEANGHLPFDGSIQAAAHRSLQQGRRQRW